MNGRKCLEQTVSTMQESNRKVAAYLQGTKKKDYKQSHNPLSRRMGIDQTGLLIQNRAELGHAEEGKERKPENHRKPTTQAARQAREPRREREGRREGSEGRALQGLLISSRLFSHWSLPGNAGWKSDCGTNQHQAAGAKRVLCVKRRWFQIFPSVKASAARKWSSNSLSVDSRIFVTHVRNSGMHLVLFTSRLFFLSQFKNIGWPPFPVFSVRWAIRDCNEHCIWWTFSSIETLVIYSVAHCSPYYTRLYCTVWRDSNSNTLWCI